MNTRLSRPARLRAGALGILGLVLLAGACDTALPTAADVEKMDVATLEARTLAVQPAATGNVTYYVDDRQVTEAEARALTSDRIVRMDVSRHETAGGDIIRIYTNDGAAAAGAEESARRQATGGTFQMRMDRQGADRNAVATFQGDPMVVIDGVISDRDALARLTPDGIAQVDVIKGAAATALYSDPRAANGVIRITTRGTGGTQ